MLRALPNLPLVRLLRLSACPVSAVTLSLTVQELSSSQGRLPCQALTHLLLVQGHALFARHAGSTLPCPYVDYEAGFNGILAGAYGLAPGETIEKLFGKKWDPYVNDATYTISMLTLEELGATGNKVWFLLTPCSNCSVFQLHLLSSQDV